MRIAFLEDDPEQIQIVTLWLRDAGYTCQHFETGQAFIRGVSRENYDLYVIDWELPDTSGVQILEWIRSNQGWDAPVLFLTVRDQEQDVVDVLNKGADDYVVKGAPSGEIVARVNALMRRAYPADPNEEVLRCEPFEIDVSGRTIRRDGNELDLTHKEFDLALFLFRNVGRLLSRGYILESVWGTRPDLNTRTVDTHVSRVRTKLRLADTSWKLTAVYQHGYRLERLKPVQE